MQIYLTGLQGVALRIEDNPRSRGNYPTARLQKGFLLVDNGQELAEEAVGFGVPVLKRGLRAIFPGGIELTAQGRGPAWEITAVFRMCLEERIGRPGLGSLNSNWLYAIKNSLAALMRRFPALRGLLAAASNGLRRTFAWETVYEDTGFYANVKMLYTVYGEEGRIHVEVDTTGLVQADISEVAVMNEQGGRAFDRYCDSGGICQQGNEIGCWDAVTADQASFISDAHRLAFNLGQAEGAKLYRGRELIGTRLAWSGFGYTFRPDLVRFAYDMRIGRLP